ncbi:MAG: hypothetical protein AB7R90_04115 [Reyranellaceae bacterium]
MSDQPQQPPQESGRAHLVAFRNFAVTDDGEHAIFAIADHEGGTHHLAVHWKDLGMMAHILNQAGVVAAQRRLAQGKPDDFTGVGAAQIVSKFAVNDVPERNLRVLSFISPSGLRSDFALSPAQKDQNGNSFIGSIAAQLLK